MFVGKGGVGKTTLAAATAVAAARAGATVLAVSIDQAHSLADVLDLPATRARATTDRIQSVAERLDAVEIDTLAVLEERFRSLVAVLALSGRHDHGAQFSALEPEEITGLPGVQELLGLAEIVALAEDGRWDTLIVDCPPTADSFRALAVPQMVSDYIERIWPQHRRIGAATGSDPRLALLVALLDRVLDSTDAVKALLVDRAQTVLRLVSTPERVVLAEARRIISGAALSGLRLDAVLVNKVLPQLGAAGDLDHPAVRWYASQRADQQRVLTRLREVVGGVAVLECEHTTIEPIGLGALGELADAVYRDGRDPRAPLGVDAATVRVQHESGTGVDAVYTMRMHLPLVDPGTLSLGRVEDDLVVEADGLRRRVRLASGLRRCMVTGADFDGTDLVIRFAPDPAVWPT